MSENFERAYSIAAFLQKKSEKFFSKNFEKITGHQCAPL